MIALLDNTVLSNFSFVERPDLVNVALGSAAATVREAFVEHERGVSLGRVPACDWLWLPILDLTANERTRLLTISPILGKGEAACIACAASRGYRVVTDDRDGRKAALQLHVPISGTLGLLQRLVDLGVLALPQADVLLTHMIASGYRTAVSSLAELR